jgi:heptosyltransferase I
MLGPDNILVIRLSSLGDVLMSIPAVVAIRNTYVDARISWLVEGSVGELLKCQDFVDDVIEFPRQKIVKAIGKSDPVWAMRELSGFVKKLRGIEYDIIADFHGIIKSAIFSRLARGKRRIGFGKAYAKEMSHLFYEERVSSGDKRIHKVERNMLLARYLGADEKIPVPILVAPVEAEEYVDDFLSGAGVSSPVFAVNPFSSSGSAYKRWDIRQYGALIRKIKGEMGHEVIILWGPGEREEAERLNQIAGGSAKLACPTSVPQLLALLKNVDMYIGGDTGVMHLAAFAGTPVVAVFGPTDVKVNAPYGGNSTVVRKELPCSPCKNKDCSDRKCVEAISVEEVFDAVAKIQGKRIAHRA